MPEINYKEAIEELINESKDWALKTLKENDDELKNLQNEIEIDEMERQAIDKYEGGYKYYHHDLSHEFKKKPEFKHIPIKEIRKVVGRVAEKYGKKSGIKKELPLQHL